MPVNTIVDTEQTQQERANKRWKKSNSRDLAVGKKYAICILELHDSVRQPLADETLEDYVTIANAIKALSLTIDSVADVVAVSDIDLLVDGATPVGIEADKKLTLVTDVQLRINDDPPPPDIFLLKV